MGMAFRISRVTQYLILGVVISALVVGYILYELSNTKQHFAMQLVTQSSQRIQSELNEFFLPVKSIMELMSQQQGMQLLTDQNPSLLNRYYIPIINQYPQISSIGIADSRGYEFNILPDTTAGNWLNREVYVDRWGMTERWHRWRKGKSLIPVDSWTQELESDPRERDWYTSVFGGRGDYIYWTEPYIYMTGELGLTASVIMEDAQDDMLQHILAMDVTLEDITRFSQNLSLTQNNQIFILTRENKNIIGLPKDYKNLSSNELMGKLLSTPEEFGNSALIKLLKSPTDEIVSFKKQGQHWWGILKTYSINQKQELLIAVLIPEKDFSDEINSTRNAIIAGFFVILLLSFLLVLNNNKLRSTSHELNKKNNLISEQKERLFAEVHHRVKNNLAVMAALMELENMESKDPSVKQVLTETQRRIKSMAAVQEVIYKSDDMRRVWIHDFVPDILTASLKDFKELDVDLEYEAEDILINVNQALTYGLLLNEFMGSIMKSGLELSRQIEVRIHKKDELLTTVIKINSSDAYLKKGKGVGKQLIEVLLAQLKAKLEATTKNRYTSYSIVFELKDKKGIASNLNY